MFFNDIIYQIDKKLITVINFFLPLRSRINFIDRYKSNRDHLNIFLSRKNKLVDTQQHRSFFISSGLLEFRKKIFRFSARRLISFFFFFFSTSLPSQKRNAFRGSANPFSIDFESIMNYVARYGFGNWIYLRGKKEKEKSWQKGIHAYDYL